MGERSFRPAMVFHPSELIRQEASARGWDLWDVARRMGGNVPQHVLALQIYSIRDPGCRMGDGLDLQRAFGIDAAFWLALEAYWVDHPEARAKVDDNDTAHEAWHLTDEEVDPLREARSAER